jgi:hypothetical protein
VGRAPPYAAYRVGQKTMITADHRTCLRILIALLCSFGLQPKAEAADLHASPSDYKLRLASLKPGDTLHLAAGTYPRLAITALNGTQDEWITITGPESGAPAVIAGASGYNTVEILNSSYVSVENLRIDSRGIPGAFGISARGHEDNLTHHIRVEGNTFVGQNGGQQTDGISTKTPTWGWVIRYNRILGAGTGIYLGDSDGTQPFVDGIIENNLIADTIGYNLEIKDQIVFPSVPGMPSGPTVTIIRNNVFIKNDQPSPDGDRPNLIVGAFPTAGPGSLNMYDIYGNLVVHNPREALFQGSGRISLHDNIFVDGPYNYPAVVLRSQNYPLRLANVYNNTIYTLGKGIYFGARAMLGDAVIGNIVFGSAPIAGAVINQSDNIVDSFANAHLYVKSPSFDLGSMDFSPLEGKCKGAPIDLSWFHSDKEYALDFDGRPKTELRGAVVFRGAYAVEGVDPDWKLERNLKPPRAPSVNPQATLVWIEPRGAPAGTSVTVELTGTNFGRGANVAVDGSGVSVEAVTPVSDTQITAKLIIARGASGTRHLSVKTDAGSSNLAAFKIKSR